MTMHYQNRAVFTVTNPEQEPFYLTLAGRNRWAMEQLVRAGKKGCTPIKNAAPRWSAYVHNLRTFGVAIETIHEQHSGKFSGNPTRCVLRAQVEGVAV